MNLFAAFTDEQLSVMGTLFAKTRQAEFDPDAREVFNALYAELEAKEAGNVATVSRFSQFDDKELEGFNAALAIYSSIPEVEPGDLEDASRELQQEIQNRIQTEKKEQQA